LFHHHHIIFSINRAGVSHRSDTNKLGYIPTVCCAVCSRPPTQLWLKTSCNSSVAAMCVV